MAGARCLIYMSMVVSDPKINEVSVMISYKTRSRLRYYCCIQTAQVYVVMSNMRPHVLPSKKTVHSRHNLTTSCHDFTNKSFSKKRVATFQGLHRTGDTLSSCLIRELEIVTIQCFFVRGTHVYS